MGQLRVARPSEHASIPLTAEWIISAIMDIRGMASLRGLWSDNGLNFKSAKLTDVCLRR